MKTYHLMDMSASSPFSFWSMKNQIPSTRRWNRRRKCRKK